MSVKVLGVLGGEDMGDRQLSTWASSADILYAADSGANRLLRLGFEPIVVGDLDSFESALAPSTLRIVQDLDTESSDIDKLLRVVQQDGHVSLTLTSFEGDLFDHMLAGLSSVLRSNLSVRFILRNATATLIRGGKSLSVPDTTGRRVSMIPLPSATGLQLTGVKWPVVDKDMDLGGYISVSNEGAGDLHAKLESGAALLFVESLPDDAPFWPA